MSIDAELFPYSTKSFQYQLLPSAFQIAEAPTYLCWKSLSSTEFYWNQKSEKSLENLKNKTIAIALGVGGYVGGIAALPITVCTASITMIADVIIGIAEIAFCKYKGVENQELFTIVHRKFIVSPCQHLTFCLTAIATTAALYVFGWTRILTSFSFPVPLCLLWSMSYALGQSVVGCLPNYLNHHSFNIFINGGSGEENCPNWLDSDFKIPQANTEEPSQRPHVSSSSEWTNFIERIIPDLNQINDVNLSEEYVTFKIRLLSKCSPADLLDLPNNFSLRDLTSRYRRLAFLFHPDKNRPRIREAEALFKALSEARNILSNDV